MKQSRWVILPLFFLFAKGGTKESIMYKVHGKQLLVNRIFSVLIFLSMLLSNLNISSISTAFAEDEPPPAVVETTLPLTAPTDLVVIPTERAIPSPGRISTLTKAGSRLSARSTKPLSGMSLLRLPQMKPVMRIST